MKSKAVVIILLLICVGLGLGLFFRHEQAVKQQQEDLSMIAQFSNRVEEVKTQLHEQRQVNGALEGDLLQRVQEIATYSNRVTSLNRQVAQVQNAAKEAAKAAEAEMAKRDAKIAELESQRDDLTKRMTELNTSIGSLETKIADTEKKLKTSEGDREFLLKELKRLQAEKAELERQFNDLATLREQVRKLRDELSIAKRLEWLRRGIMGGGLKGAERLQQGFEREAEPSTGYDLDVTIRQDGGTEVNPPSTNAPSGATNTPPK